MQVTVGTLLLALALQFPGKTPRLEGVGEWDIVIDVHPTSGRARLSLISPGTIVQLTKSGSPILIAATGHSCTGRALVIRVDQGKGIILGEMGRRNVALAFKQMLTAEEAVIAYYPQPCRSIHHTEVKLEGFAETVEKLKQLPTEEVDALVASVVEEREKSNRAIEERTTRSDPGELLTSAARDGDLVKVIALLAQRVDVNTRTETNGYTPLIWASSRGHAETVRTLVNSGADLNAQANDGQTALMRACDNGRTEIVAIMVGAGADVDVATEQGVTALTLATLKGHQTIIELLQYAGAK